MHDRGGVAVQLRTVARVGIGLFALALGGCADGLELDDAAESSGTDDLEAEDEPGDVLGTSVDEQHGNFERCDDLGDAPSCLDAGCRWQPMFGAMIEDDGACTTSEPLGLCFAQSFAQPCDLDARQCADGTYAWVIPGPDDAVVVARSITSCGVPEHFMPCPTTPDDLTADIDAPPSGAGDLAAVVASACTCACDEPS